MLVLLLLLLMFLLFLLLFLLFGFLVALWSVGKRSDPKGAACPSGSSKHSSPSLPPHPSVPKEKPPKKAICGGFHPHRFSSTFSSFSCFFLGPDVSGLLETFWCWGLKSKGGIQSGSVSSWLRITSKRDFHPLKIKIDLEKN